EGFGPIYIAGSNDGGRSFESPSRTKVSDDRNTRGFGSVPAITKNGTVCVAWLENTEPFDVFKKADIVVDCSSNGGRTWGTDQVVATNSPAELPSASKIKRDIPTLAVDRSQPSSFYVAWPANSSSL